jgi:uncharacterized protein
LRLAVAVAVIAILLASRVGLVDLIARGYRHIGWAVMTLYLLPLLTVGLVRLFGSKVQIPRILALSAAMAMSVATPARAAAPLESGAELTWGVQIPLRDGVKLNATVYRPRAQSDPLPCVVTLTPYVGDTYHQRGIYFATHGYVFLTVDVRGRGNSEGHADLFRQEAHDGYDIVEWLARQPYCNGKVGMWGGSYAGYDQWATASQRPPHLATIAPAAASFPGVDFPQLDNIVSAGVIQWLTLVSGHTLQLDTYEDESYWRNQYLAFYLRRRRFDTLDSFVGHPVPLFHEWLAHPHQDAYWDSYNPADTQYAAIDLPILTITGQYDDDQAGALEHYHRHLRNASPPARDRHYLIIGPWNHAQTRTPQSEVDGLQVGPASVLDMDRLHREWYDWTLKSGSRPEFLKQHVAYYVTGAELWRYAETLQQVTAATRTLYLSSDGGRANDVFHSGRLQESAPSTAASDHYVYDPSDLQDKDLLTQLDPTRLTEQRDVLLSVGRELIYHSAPFATDTEVCGFFHLELWLMIDAPDTDFYVAIYDIAADGGSVLLTRMAQRARYRNSPRAAHLVPAGKALEYHFEQFPFVARRIAKGHRLRLVVGPLGSIYMQKNYNSGGTVAQEDARDERVVHVQLFHDAQHPSALWVPLGADGE